MALYFLVDLRAAVPRFGGGCLLGGPQRSADLPKYNRTLTVVKIITHIKVMKALKQTLQVSFFHFPNTQKTEFTQTTSADWVKFIASIVASVDEALA